MTGGYGDQVVLRRRAREAWEEGGTSPAEIKYMPDKHGYLMVELEEKEAIDVRTEEGRAMRVLTCNNAILGTLLQCPS